MRRLSRVCAPLSTNPRPGFTLPKLLGITLAANKRSIFLTMTPALQIRGLCKSFDRPAVAGLDLTVRAGEFYSLLGPNGAGKTTTLRMVTDRKSVV